MRCLRRPCGLLGVAVLPTLVQAGGQTVTVKSNDPSITYGSGAWYESQACGGTHYSFGLFQTFEYQFTGTSIRVVGTTDLSGGFLTFTLDGNSTLFNRYSTAKYDQQCGTTLFSQTGLTATQHTLLVNHTADINRGTTSADQFVEWQYLQYTAAADMGGSNGAAIGGGVAGGIALLLAIVGGWYYFAKRRRNRESTDINGGYPAAAPANTNRRSVLQKQNSEVPVWPTLLEESGAQVTPWIPTAAPAPILHRADVSRDSNVSDFDPYNLPPTAGIIGEKMSLTGTPYPSAVSRPPSTLSPGPSAAEGSVAGSSSSRPGAIGEKSDTSRQNTPQMRLSPEIRRGLPPLSDPDLDRLASRVASMITTGPERRPTLPPGAARPDTSATPAPTDDAPPEYSR